MPDTTRTNDPNIVVESYQRGRVVYRDLMTGERWAEVGECNRCGLCVAPDDPDVVWTGARGELGACLDVTYETRPLYVVRPSILAVIPECSLRFEEELGD